MNRKAVGFLSIPLRIRLLQESEGLSLLYLIVLRKLPIVIQSIYIYL